MNSGDAMARRQALQEKLEARIRGKAMPVGALGRIQDLAMQIGLATGSMAPDLGDAVAIVFAGDHGITAEGVTAYPSVVTGEIAKIILAGTAGVSVCARGAGISVRLVDCGLLQPLDPHPLLLDRRIGPGTRNAYAEPAMTEDELQRAYNAGQAIAEDAIRNGAGLLALGEIGIGNTSAAALVAHAITGLELEALIGPGAGVPALGLDHKRRILREAFTRAALPTDPPSMRAFAALRHFAGYEMVAMAGAMTATASRRRIVIVDGFIASAVAAAVLAIMPAARDHMVFAHCSAEPGHIRLLEHLGTRPLLDLGLRLGEGTGAVLAVPIVRAAELMLRDMADLPGEHPA